MPKTDIHYESFFLLQLNVYFLPLPHPFFLTVLPAHIWVQALARPNLTHPLSIYSLFSFPTTNMSELEKISTTKLHIKFKLVKLLDCLQTAFCPFTKFMCVSPILFPFLDKTIYIAWGISLAKGIKMVKVNFPNSIHTREWSNMKL